MATINASEKVLDSVRTQLQNRGVKTIRGLGRSFRTMDSYNGDRKIDKEEFYWGLKDFGVDITKQQALALLQCLDTDEDGYVNFDEFLKGIRGAPNSHRQAVIDQAYLKFDKNGDGCITSADLKTVYDTSFHPKVQTGEMTEDDVFLEFLGSFGDKNGDGKITRAEWNDHYAAVSSNIDHDEHFVALMRRAWKLD